MNYQVTIDFFTSISALSKSDQKQVRDAIKIVIRDNRNNGLRFHKINHPSKNIFSYSATEELRVIIYKNDNTITFLYTDHHDKAYEWIKERKFIQIDDSIRIISIQSISENHEGELIKSSPLAKSLKRYPNLKSSEEYQKALVNITNDDEALEFIENLEIPSISKDELLAFIIKRTSNYHILPPGSVQAIDSDLELQEALKYPLDLWRIFLHPIQKEIANAHINCSRVITGGPGTGKTVCIAHRIKNLVKQLKDNEIVLVSTYKEMLSDYITEMLHKLNVEVEKVIILDVSELKRIAIPQPNSDNKVILKDFSDLSEVFSEESLLNGCFLISSETVYFMINGKRRIVKHLLIDEYQDFKKQHHDAIQQLCSKIPYTIAFDYTQAIYRKPSDEIKEMLGDNTNLVELDYCYRLNDQIIKRLKAVVYTIRVLSSYATSPQYQISLLPFEEHLISNLRPAVLGKPPTIFRYSSSSILEEYLLQEAKNLESHFKEEEIVITAFSSDLYKFPRENTKFHSELVPKEVERFYRYVYTLKGREYKAGIVILDDSICQMLNLNQGLFSRTTPEGLRGDSDNLRRLLNLLYVALSRFRDHITICYPEKYSVFIDFLFDS